MRTTRPGAGGIREVATTTYGRCGRANTDRTRWLRHLAVTEKRYDLVRWVAGARVCS